MRFTLECIAAIRTNVGPDFPILVKFTPVHKVEGFRQIDEGIAMAKILESAGIEALHVDVGCYEAWYKAISTVYNEEGHQLDVVKAIKENVSLPVLGQGKLFDPKKAQEVVAQGVLDYVVLGHQMLADPHWANKVKQGNTMDIAPCVGCNECLLAGFSGKHYYCAVNPLCYAEKEFALPKVDGIKKSVLVIGGGPGGMYAAITARKRGYEVDLYEKEERLGGTLWAAGMPTFKHDVLKLITYLERQCLKTGVNVYLNTEFTLKDAKKDYDKVILSAGSSPMMPPIPGIEKAGFVSEFLTDRKEAGKQIVIIGGGLAGCEAACYLKENAETVTIIEMQEDILFGCDHCLNNDQALRQMLQDNNINKITKATVTKIEDNRVTYLQDNQEYTIVCDTIINAAGFKPNDQLEDALEEIYDDVTVIGDAKAPRKILTAIHEGYHAIRVME